VTKLHFRIQALEEATRGKGFFARQWIKIKSVVDRHHNGRLLRQDALGTMICYDTISDT